MRIILLRIGSSFGLFSTYSICSTQSFRSSKLLESRTTDGRPQNNQGQFRQIDASASRSLTLSSPKFHCWVARWILSICPSDKAVLSGETNDLNHPVAISLVWSRFWLMGGPATSRHIFSRRRTLRSERIRSGECASNFRISPTS